MCNVIHNMLGWKFLVFFLILCMVEFWRWTWNGFFYLEEYEMNTRKLMPFLFLDMFFFWGFCWTIREPVFLRIDSKLDHSALLWKIVMKFCCEIRQLKGGRNWYVLQFLLTCPSLWNHGLEGVRNCYTIKIIDLLLVLNTRPPGVQSKLHLIRIFITLH
jgi:hypothetical protein